MPRLSSLPDRVTRAFERACRHCLGDVPELARVTSDAIAAVTAGRSARTIRSIHYQIDKWMDWWESAGRPERPGSMRSVSDYLGYLEASKRVPSTIALRLGTMIQLLAAIGWPDPQAAGALQLARKPYHILMRRLRKPVSPRPIGWDQIQACLPLVDLTKKHQVRAIAVLLVLYDSLAREDAVLGHSEGRVWQVNPPRRSDLRRMPDGSGRLRLRTPTRAVGYFDAVLTPTTMTWLDRVLSQRRDADGPLFLSGCGRAWHMGSWRVTVSKLLERAGAADRVITGRAVRVGKARDLARAGSTLHAIQRAGFWASIESVRHVVGSAMPPEPQTGDLFRDACFAEAGSAYPAIDPPHDSRPAARSRRFALSSPGGTSPPGKRAPALPHPVHAGCSIEF